MTFNKIVRCKDCADTGVQLVFEMFDDRSGIGKGFVRRRCHCVPAPKVQPRVKHERVEIEGRDTSKEMADCTLRATCAVLDLPYSVVREAFRRAGRKPRRGCSKFIQEKAWRELGYRFVPTNHAVKARTVGSLEKKLTRDQDVLPLLVYVSQHLTAFINTRCIEPMPIGRRIAYHGTGRLEKIKPKK